MIDDTEELIDYLRRTYDKKKIFVMGHSWGTILGLSVAERRPEWLYAYIGAGQIINMREGERIGYKFVLDTARKTGDVQALNELTAIAPYPESNGDIPLDKINVERKWSVRYGGLTYGRKSYDVWEDAETISPDYSPADFHSIHAGSVFSLPQASARDGRDRFQRAQAARLPGDNLCRALRLHDAQRAPLSGGTTGLRRPRSVSSGSIIPPT